MQPKPLARSTADGPLGVDGGLERIRRTSVGALVARAEVVDDVGAPLERTVLAELEFHFACARRQTQRGQHADHGRVRRIVAVHRRVFSLGLIAVHQTVLLRCDGGRIPRELRRAFERDRAMIRRCHRRIVRVDPVRRNVAERLVHFEQTTGADFEICNLLVFTVQMQLEAAVHGDEGKQAEVWHAIVTYRHEPTQAGTRDELGDRLLWRIGIVVVVNHGATIART